MLKRKSKPDSGKMALCLSGGGFRASIFHMGAVRRIVELGLFEKISTVSCVSGGSIFGAFLADKLRVIPIKELASRWEAEVALPFRQVVSQDMRTLLILSHLPWNWINPTPMVRHFQRRIHKRITQIRFEELPPKPDFVFCATDVAFGVNFEFQRRRFGDYELGYKRKVTEPVALGVTASACFPPVFGPLRLPFSVSDFTSGRYKAPDRKKIIEHFALSDGGLYDNLGLEPVQKGHKVVLVSDCGSPFEFRTNPHPIQRIMRYTEVLMKQVSSLRKRLLFEVVEDDGGKAVYWTLKGGAHYRPSKNFQYSKKFVGEVIAEVRTDLDAFTPAEIGVLENHGYATADRGLHTDSRGLKLRTSPFVLPQPKWINEALARKKMKGSAKRFSLKRLLWTAVRGAF